MEAIVLAVAALACPVGMGAMMWFMAKGKRKDKPAEQPGGVTDLRSEHARLGAEIERLERAREADELRVELDAREKHAVSPGPTPPAFEHRRFWRGGTSTIHSSTPPPYAVRMRSVRQDLSHQQDY